MQARICNGVFLKHVHEISYTTVINQRDRFFRSYLTVLISLDIHLYAADTIFRLEVNYRFSIYTLGIRQYNANMARILIIMFHVSLIWFSLKYRDRGDFCSCQSQSDVHFQMYSGIVSRVPNGCKRDYIPFN